MMTVFPVNIQCFSVFSIPVIATVFIVNTVTVSSNYSVSV